MAVCWRTMCWQDTVMLLCWLNTQNPLLKNEMGPPINQNHGYIIQDYQTTMQPPTTTPAPGPQDVQNTLKQMPLSHPILLFDTRY